MQLLITPLFLLQTYKVTYLLGLQQAVMDLKGAERKRNMPLKLLLELQQRIQHAGAGPDWQPPARLAAGDGRPARRRQLGAGARDGDQR